MKKQLLVIGVTMAGLVACAQKDMTAAQEAVQEGHGYTPKGYVHPKEPEVRERLEKRVGTDPAQRAFYRALCDFNPLNDLGSG